MEKAAIEFKHLTDGVLAQMSDSKSDVHTLTEVRSTQEINTVTLRGQ